MVRLAGLPVTVLAGLRFPETARSVETLARGQEWLIREGRALADALHTPIGELAGHPAKPRLVAVRRALHRGRAPGRSEWRPDLGALLPPPLAARITSWLDRHTGWQRDRAAVDQLLATEHADRLPVLRRLATDPVFRRGLWHASPSLSDELDRWLRDPDRTPRRQIQLRLAKYLARASAKTAVFSSFAATGFGRWTGAGDGPDDASGDDPGPAIRPTPDPDLRTVTVLSEPLRDQLPLALATEPDLWSAVAVRINPSRTTGPNGADHWLVGPPPAEPIRVLKPQPLLQECLDLLGRLAGPAGWSTVAELTGRLGEATGAGAAPLRGYLVKLAEAGLLELGPPPLARPEVSLAGLADWAATGDDPPLAAQVARLEEALRATERQPEPAAQRHHHRAVTTATRELADRLGLAFDLPRAANEDIVAARPVADCPTPAWRPVLADLTALRGWLGLFDPAVPVRQALRHWWQAHLPDDASVPLLVLHQRFRTIAAELDPLLTRPTFPADLLASPIPGLAEVGRLRQAALADLPTTPDREGRLRSPVVDLAKAAASWPSWVRPIDELTCYLQHDGHQGILNRLDTGYGMVSHRTGYLLRQAGADPALPAHPGRAVSAGGAGGAGMDQPGVLAELGGLHGTALNAREPYLPYEIDYPFSPSTRPAEERIPIADLRVARNRDGSLRLHSTRLNTGIHPVYTGALMVPQLPPLARLLVTGFGPPAPPYRIPMPDPGPLTGPQRLPRVSFGSVVVRRARWAFPPEHVPTRAAGETDAGYLLRLARWRHEHGVPERCFVRAMPPEQSEPPLRGRDARTYWNLRKPFYLDFTSWFLVLAFENILRTPRRFVVFEEALPDPAGADPRVSELLVEVPGQEVGDYQ